MRAVVAAFFSAYPHPLDDTALSRVLAPILSSAKSANASVRADAVALFRALAPAAAPRSEDLLTPLRTGKTSGAEHRAARARSRAA